MYFYKWRFYRESYEGTGGYGPYVRDITVIDTWPTDEGAGTLYLDTSDRTYLYKHPRERNKFRRRVIMAYLPNVIKRSLNMMVGYITKQTPTRNDWPDRLTKWMSDCNGAGDAWDVFKNTELVTPCLYYGFLPILVHRKPSTAQTQAQLDLENNQPTVSIINPEALIDWVWDDSLNIRMAKVKEKVDVTDTLFTKAHATIDRYWYYTPEGWWYADDNGEDDDIPIVDVQPWSKPRESPFITWRLGLTGRSMIADAATTQRELYNVRSEITEQRRETLFCMLSAPDAGGDENDIRSKRVGSDNVWWFPHDSRHRPDWMAPPAVPMDQMREESNGLALQILEEMGLDFDSGGGTTGMAFSFKMSKIVRLLKDTVASLQRAENQTLREVCRQLGQEADDKAISKWPTEFDAKDVAKELEAMQMLVDMGVGPTFEAEAKYRSATTAMPDMDETARQKGKSEIETEIEEAEEGMDLQPGMIPQQQQPVVSNLTQQGPSDKTIPNAKAR
jgi:hypothetical protein